MTRVFVHIGLHKTGTTAIQKGLALNRTALLREGFHFPMALGPDQKIYGHHLVAWSVFKRSNYLPPLAHLHPPSRVRETLLEEIQKAPNIILSSEEFDCLTLEEIHDFKSIMPTAEIIPIIFIRRFSEFFESAFRTSVIHGNYQGTADDFIERQRTRMDYQCFLKDWLTISEGKGIAVNYDDPAVAGDSFTAFLEAIEINLPKVSHPNSVNPSHPAFICELVRFMRSKGCPHNHAMKWAEQMSMKGLKEQWCLSPQAIAKQDDLYNAEIENMMADPEIHPILRQPLLRIEKREPTVHVGNAVSAILAMGNSFAAVQ